MKADLRLEKRKLEDHDFLVWKSPSTFFGIGEN